MNIREGIFDLIDVERQVQEKKWGTQEHAPEFWMLVLVEEIGEAARAFLQCRIVEGCAELVQAAAVLVAWMEYLIKKILGTERLVAVRLRITEEWEEHPENYNDSCACQVCQSYTDS